MTYDQFKSLIPGNYVIRMKNNKPEAALIMEAAEWHKAQYLRVPMNTRSKPSLELIYFKTNDGYFFSHYRNWEAPNQEFNEAMKELKRIEALAELLDPSNAIEQALIDALYGKVKELHLAINKASIN
jgi:hypothetical protein